MAGAPRITLTAPPEARARYLAMRYADVVADRATFDAAMARLPVWPGRKAIAHWRELADAGDLTSLAAELMAHHYDPAYDRSARKDARPTLATVMLAGLDEADQQKAADEIARLILPPLHGEGGDPGLDPRETGGAL
jgi:tRNA 2-selenouridine synthase